MYNMNSTDKKRIQIHQIIYVNQTAQDEARLVAKDVNRHDKKIIPAVCLNFLKNGASSKESLNCILLIEHKEILKW